MEKTMRKNRAMRAAAGVMVATLVSTCAFSGVMAKYVSSDYDDDAARVAKFGVVATASGDLFGPSYAKKVDGDSVQTWNSSGNGESVSVNATDGKVVKVLAPGTKNDKGMTFSVKGTPEVSTKLTIDAPEGDGGNGGTDNNDFVNTDIYLNAGDYSIMEKVNVADVAITNDNKGDYYKLSGTTFEALSDVPTKSSDTWSPEYVYKKVNLTVTSGEDTVKNKMTASYYPIKWSVKSGTADAESAANVAEVNTKVLAALAGGTNGNNIAEHTPNQVWNGTAKVTWAWDYVGDITSYPDASAWNDLPGADSALNNWENTNLVDLEDTVLGQMMARVESGANQDGADYLVAKGSTLVQYKSVNASSDGKAANNVTVAYTTTAPNNYSSSDTNICACLTATYGARLTIEQVD